MLHWRVKEDMDVETEAINTNRYLAVHAIYEDK